MAHIYIQTAHHDNGTGAFGHPPWRTRRPPAASFRTNQSDSTDPTQLDRPAPTRTDPKTKKTFEKSQTSSFVGGS